MIFFVLICINFVTCELPWCLRWKRIFLKCWRPGFNSWVWKIPWRREWQSIPAFLPGEFQGQRSLAGSPWGHKESAMTEQLTLTLHHLWGWIHMHLLFKICFENWPYILTFFHWIAVYLFSVLFKGINSCHFEYVVNIFLLSTLSLAVYFVKI